MRPHPGSFRKQPDEFACVVGAVQSHHCPLSALIVILSSLGYRDTLIIVTFTLIRAFGGFVGGCFLYTVYQNGSLHRLPRGTIAVTAALAIMLLSYGNVTSFLAMPIFGLLILGLAYGKGPVAWALSTRKLMFLGEVSYSMPMLHFLVLEIVFAPVRLTGLAKFGNIVVYPTFALGLICVAVATFLVFHLIEKPGRSAVRRLLLSRLVP